MPSQTVAESRLTVLRGRAKLWSAQADQPAALAPWNANYSVKEIWASSFLVGVTLSRSGLHWRGSLQHCSRLHPRAVSALDSVAAIPQLQDIGRRLADSTDLEHFGPFV